MRKPISINCDLSNVTLRLAIKEATCMAGGVICDMYNVKVSDGCLFSAIVIRESRCYDKEKSEFCYKKVYFELDKDLEKDHWEVKGFYKGKFYTIYSEGA